MSIASKSVTLQYPGLQQRPNESHRTQDDFALYVACEFGKLIESWKIPSHIEDMCKIEMPEDQVKVSSILADYLESTMGQYFINLQLKYYFDVQKFVNKTEVDEIIDLSWLPQHNTSIFSNLELGISVEGIHQILETRVASKFKGVGEVSAIYSDEYKDELRFTVFTSNQTYDDKLMSELLKIECDIRLPFLDSPICFQYIPALYDSAEEILPGHAKLIYKRGKSAVTTSSFMASWT